MSHYTIIELEDFMPPQHVNAIEDLLESPDINWVFCQTTLKPYGLTKDPVWLESLPDSEMKEKVIDTHMMVHMHFDSQGPNKEKPLIMREFDCISTILLLAQQNRSWEYDKDEGILDTSKFFLCLPFNIFPDGNLSFCEFIFFPFSITS